MSTVSSPYKRLHTEPRPDPTLPYRTFLNKYSGYQKLGSGNYSNAFLVGDKVIKTFHDDCIMKHTRTRALDRFIRTAHGQYFSAKEKGINVPALYNDPLKDLHWEMEFIPHAVHVDWQDKTSIEEISELSRSILKQIKEMFAIDKQNRLHLDLMPDNVRLRDNGEVVLIDFREDEDAEDFEIDMRKNLVEWCQGSKAVLKYLNPGFSLDWLLESERLQRLYPQLSPHMHPTTH